MTARKRQAKRPQATSPAAVSIRDVAKAAGVSTASVSRCINHADQVADSTRSRVMRAIEELGYTPNSLARDFRRGRTHMLLVVLPSVGDPFFSGVMRGVHSAAAARGFGVIISDTQLNSISATEMELMLVSRQADGILLLGTASPFGGTVLSGRGRGALPIVIGCEVVSPDLAGYASVHIDNRLAAHQATTHLLELGHRRIAFLSGIEGSLLTAERERGFLERMQAAGIPQPQVLSGGLTADGAQAATQTLLATDPRPTALFCANDEMAIGAAHCIRRAGLRIPQDISLMGFDDTRYAALLHPPLTTVRQPSEEIGRRSVNLLCDSIEQLTPMTTAPAPEILPHSLVIRDSTGPAP